MPDSPSARGARALRLNGARVAPSVARSCDLQRSSSLRNDPGSWATLRRLEDAARGAAERFPAEVPWQRRHEALAAVPLVVAALGSVTRAARLLDARARDVSRWKAAALAMLAGLEWKAGGFYAPNVIIETIKCAEDGNGIIVRLYESQRQRGPVQIRAGTGIQSAWETNLLEENESPLEIENDTIDLTLRPYQIMTIRVIEKK